MDDGFVGRVAEQLTRANSVGRVLSKQHLEHLITAANFQLKLERSRGLGDLQGQLDMFQLLATTGTLPRLADSDVGWLLFDEWVRQSPNLFAVAYRMGQDRAPTQVSTRGKSNVSVAIRTRKALGEETRRRVKMEADKLIVRSKKLTKGDASDLIAKKISKSTDTVKRYLSELYPGNKWPK